MVRYVDQCLLYFNVWVKRSFHNDVVFVFVYDIICKGIMVMQHHRYDLFTT